HDFTVSLLDALPIYQSLHDGLVVAEEAELGQTELKALLVENTHDDALAVRGRQGRDAQVDLLARHVNLDTAVLRDAFLGDRDVRSEEHTSELQSREK